MPDVVIRSKRGKLLMQVTVVSGIGVIAGAVLQRSDLLGTSPLGRLSNDTGLPLVLLAVAGAAVAIGIAMVRDTWNSSITLESTGMTVRDRLGRYTLAYSNIDGVKAAPMGGVVISVRDRDQWLASATGDAHIRRKTADVIRPHYDGDVLFSDNQLSVGAAQFVALLESRVHGTNTSAGRETE
jgi:hypothetical protein